MRFHMKALAILTFFMLMISLTSAPAVATGDGELPPDDLTDCEELFCPEEQELKKPQLEEIILDEDTPLGFFDFRSLPIQACYNMQASDEHIAMRLEHMYGMYAPTRILNMSPKNLFVDLCEENCPGLFCPEECELKSGD